MVSMSPANPARARSTATFSACFCGEPIGLSFITRNVVPPPTTTTATSAAIDRVPFFFVTATGRLPRT